MSPDGRVETAEVVQTTAQCRDAALEALGLGELNDIESVVITGDAIWVHRRLAVLVYRELVQVWPAVLQDLALVTLADGTEAVERFS